MTESSGKQCGFKNEPGFRRGTPVRFSSLFLIVLLLGSGCASHSPTPTKEQLSQKKMEVAALEDEIEILTRQLGHFQEYKANSPKYYPPKDQMRDLDNEIRVLRQARDAINAEMMRVIKSTMEAPISWLLGI